MTQFPTKPGRRAMLQAAAGLAMGMIGHERLAAAGQAIGADADTPSAGGRTPGKPGDFDFLSGEWKIRHRRLKAQGGDEWDEFEGEATCWSILGGIGSIEELRIPARNFSGMGLRLLDVEQRIWSDFWVNARSGVLTTPGQTGSFENGDGIFGADDMDGDTPIKVRGVWDRITPTSCRWHQAISRDEGKSWQANWYMDWTRA